MNNNRANRQAARRARRASLLPVAAHSPALLYWGVVYADSALTLVRGAGGEKVMKVRKSPAAHLAAKFAHTN